MTGIRRLATGNKQHRCRQVEALRCLQQTSQGGTGV